MASSSSVASDSQYRPPWKYDVFLSFRGVDTRRTFTGHLYEALKNRGIHTFQDDKSLKEGDSIPEELSEAIEESQVALIIFSKNYATSGWCLSELVKIIECKEKNGQTIIPIFYDVDPSHVRHQSESFAKAFAKHESRFKDDVEGMQKVQAWKTALTAAANLKGYDIRDGIESEKIQEIVDDISSKFCKSARSLYFLQDVVGLNAHLEKLKSLLQIEINDVRVLGIWGIGGIGKTTIAKALFDTLSYQFKGACFLADVKENARKNQLYSLQNTLLSELLRRKDDYVNNKHDGKSIISSRLSSMKVLIVLDDINRDEHLEYLAGDVGWFGNGSRVIVTTRDRHLIEKDDAIYGVPTLPDDEAMQLFNQHAFKKEVPDDRFKELSLEVVDHAKGLPLALKVWGSLLNKKGLPQWRKTVDQIKKNSNSEIVETLKISNDGLEPQEQKIFLDMACFFYGYGRKRAMEIIESCCFGAEYGLDVLIDMKYAIKKLNDSEFWNAFSRATICVKDYDRGRSRSRSRSRSYSRGKSASRSRSRSRSRSKSASRSRSRSRSRSKSKSKSKSRSKSKSKSPKVKSSKRSRSRSRPVSSRSRSGSKARSVSRSPSRSRSPAPSRSKQLSKSPKRRTPSRRPNRRSPSRSSSRIRSRSCIRSRSRSRSKSKSKSPKVKSSKRSRSRSRSVSFRSRSGSKARSVSRSRILLHHNENAKRFGKT